MQPLFLIVEDEPITTRLIFKVLEEQDYRIAGIAKSGKEAREIAAHERVDVVLMDINIQGREDGIQLARKFTDERVAVIFMSAYSDKETLIDAAETLPYGFLIKPFREADLLAAVLMTLSRLKKERSEYRAVPQDKALFGTYRLDPKQNLLYHDDEEIMLSKNETRSLELFFNRPDTLIGTEELCMGVWGEKKVGDSTIRELIKRLRSKAAGLHIENVYGTGYILKK